jgi:hypothetical protein
MTEIIEKTPTAMPSIVNSDRSLLVFTEERAI